MSAYVLSSGRSFRRHGNCKTVIALHRPDARGQDGGTASTCRRCFRPDRRGWFERVEYRVTAIYAENPRMIRSVAHRRPECARCSLGRRVRNRLARDCAVLRLLAVFAHPSCNIGVTAPRTQVFIESTGPPPRQQPVALPPPQHRAAGRPAGRSTGMADHAPTGGIKAASASGMFVARLPGVGNIDLGRDLPQPGASCRRSPRKRSTLPARPRPLHQEASHVR